MEHVIYPPSHETPTYLHAYRPPTDQNTHTSTNPQTQPALFQTVQPLTRPNNSPASQLPCSTRTTRTNCQPNPTAHPLAINMQTEFRRNSSTTPACFARSAREQERQPTVPVGNNGYVAWVAWVAWVAVGSNGSSGSSG